MYQGHGNKMVHQKTVPESSEKTSWSNPGEWSEFEKPGTICYILATYRFSLVLRWQANFFLVCTPVFLPRGDCNRQKVRDSICNLVCTESGGGWNTELDWGTRKGSQVPQFGHSPVSASIDPVHFCHDLIDSVAGIAHLLGNSNGKTHFPVQEGRSLQVSMQGWERPPRYFIKICTVIFPLLGRDNLDLVYMCVCFSCLQNIWLRCSCAACSDWGVWDGLIPALSPSCHCWQLSVKPLLKGLYWGETQSLP